MFFVNKRFLCYFDWAAFGLLLLLSCISLSFVFSATYKLTATTYSIFFKKQLVGILTGICIYFFCSFVDYRTLCRVGYWLYIFTMFLLIFTLFKGSVGMGAQRWINLGFIKFQPSELAKIFFPMFITYYFLHDTQNSHPTASTYIIPILVLGSSFILVLKQPDLGTALILLFSGSCMFWFIGLSTRFFLIVAACLLITAPISWQFLKPYQKKRILVFLGQGNKNKERYQIEQSKIAVGSGGIWGKGYLQGTQNKLSFLPESRTDFIFSVICEETGLLGAIMILLLYLMLFVRILWLINTITGFYPHLMCLGLLMPIILSTIINVCMILDLLPIVGIPLPFMSYGITHIWTGFASLGCINSITCQRYFQEL
ncbi:MAG: rod shape-determining protein RodA [Epsilonproteobacteria bacterium]|nr:rod shape-determining protein RodA [Campylobacterota bacterium]|tara:strand:- start:336 stop:1445 length:1110 start_codon:yes stop_codon:yes gene_type:complete